MADQPAEFSRERALRQLRQMTPDPDVTYVGRASPSGVVFRHGAEDSTLTLILWIARHAVLPGQPQARGLLLLKPDAPPDAIVASFIEAVLPDPAKNLAPILPGRVEVTDEASARLLREALRGLGTTVAVVRDVPLFNLAAFKILSSLHTSDIPLPLWEASVGAMRPLASAAANCFRREPWGTLSDLPPVEVAVGRYGIGSLWFSPRLGDITAPTLVAFLSLDDLHRAGRAAFVADALDDVDGDLEALDLPDDDVALARELVAHPESALGEALVVTFASSMALSQESLRQVQAARLPIAGRDAIPLFARLSRQGVVRRPNEDEARALALGIEAFNAFYLRHYAALTDEQWHFGPLAAQMPVRGGGERVTLPVRVASLVPTFDPALRDRVFVMRVILEDHPAVWREIEVLAQQSADDLEGALRDAFGWPVSPYGVFLPHDPTDGDESYATTLASDMVSTPHTPVGLLVQAVRDSCHYLYDPDGASIEHRVRLVRLAERDPAGVYPRLVRAYGAVPEDLLAAAQRAEADENEADDDDDDDEP